MTITAEQQAKLRAPFPREAIGKLPRVTCRACSNDKQRKHCDQHQRAKCGICNNYITTAHLHLDYVGHAEVTDRLLSVDREWVWEPMAFGQNGLPAVDGNGGLWIRLTVAGVTRIGYGHADGKTGADAVKEAIGDAIRNAAMRFGVALDLWGAHGDTGDDEPANGQVHGRGQAPAPQANGRQQAQRLDTPPPEGMTVEQARGRLAESAKANRWDLTIVGNRYKAAHGHALKSATDPAVVEAFRKALFEVPDAELRPASANGATR